MRSVSEELCRERTTAIRNDIRSVQKDVETIKHALVGRDLKGGLVKDIAILKERGRSSLTGKEKTAIVVSVLAAVSSVIITLWR